MRVPRDLIERVRSILDHRSVQDGFSDAVAIVGDLDELLEADTQETPPCARCRKPVEAGDRDYHRIYVEKAMKTEVMHWSCICEQVNEDLAAQRDTWRASSRAANASFRHLFEDARKCLASFGGDPKGVSQFDVFDKIQERRRSLEAADAQKLVQERDRVTEMLEEARKRTQALDDAYDERNRVIVALAKLAHRLGWKAGFKYDEKADGGFKWCVFIDLHTDAYKEATQVSWHMPEDIARQFRNVNTTACTLLKKARCLPAYEGTYDGHTTAEKYQRLDDMLLGAGPEKAVQNLKRERDDALKESRPVAEWCHAVLAVVRATENESVAKSRRWRALGTKATGALDELEAFCKGVTAAYEAIKDIPGWTGYENAANGEPTEVLHHAISVHEKAAAQANARLEYMVEIVASDSVAPPEWREKVEAITVK